VPVEAAWLLPLTAGDDRPLRPSTRAARSVPSGWSVWLAGAMFADLPPFAAWRFVDAVDGFVAVLTYDAAGLVVDYPGIAVRFA